MAGYSRRERTSLSEAEKPEDLVGATPHISRDDRASAEKRTSAKYIKKPAKKKRGRKT
jgi:hypothetical protein